MKDNAFNSPELIEIWGEKSDIIRRFLNDRYQYEELSREVAFILEKRLKSSNIEYSTVSNRAKTLNSFAEKIARKKYDDPFGEITDIAGVRVVYLYASDQPLIENIIKDEFEVIEKVDKINEQGVDKFGYGAVHFLVTLGKRSSGARYEDLKDLICEIQVRTVLQDAWAIIDHHLAYKRETDVPKVLIRKLNSLSGLFETADDQFDRIRIEREKYINNIKIGVGVNNINNQEVNFDTLNEFLKRNFPVQEVANGDSHISLILNDMVKPKYAEFTILEEILKATAKAREALTQQYGKSKYAAGELARAIAFYDKDMRKDGFNIELRDKFNELDYMVL